ncbi:MAG TPA: hypothetical protein VF305_03495 [Smithellaceae bacterium]
MKNKLTLEDIFQQSSVKPGIKEIYSPAGLKKKIFAVKINNYYYHLLSMNII